MHAVREKIIPIQDETLIVKFTGLEASVSLNALIFTIKKTHTFNNRP